MSSTARRATSFIIGAGRSGTTLLYKLLCLHPQVAYLSNIEQRLPWLPLACSGRMRLRSFTAKLRYWFLASGNAYTAERPLLHRLMPTPVEGELFYQRHGLPAFMDADISFRDGADGQSLPLAFARLQKAARKTLFVSKRTANNRRLPTINASFPGAKFINLKRDGRDVAASLSRVAWWNDHPLWWDPQHRSPLQVLAQGEDMLQLCARNWVAETEAIERGLTSVATAQVLDIRFEDLVAAPVAEMKRVIEFLGLAASVDFERAITSLQLSVRPGAWRQSWNVEQIALVNREQAPQLARQGYVL
jgi:hypothetical protein